jgi:hypothetical protein
MRRPLVRLLPIVFTLFSTLAAQQKPTPPVTNSPKGFDQQYQKLLQAYEEGDEQETRGQFQTFLIPKQWFTDTFGPDQGPKLADQYWELFLNFVSETTAEFQSVTYTGAAGRSAQLQTRVWRSDEASPPVPKVTPAAVLPLPQVRQFQIRYQSGPSVDYSQPRPTYYGQAPARRVLSVRRGQEDLWVDSFIYLEGGFRFFGGDTYPFWDPCSKTGPRPSGHLIQRVTPIYPKDAPSPLGVHPYLVEMRITVAKDGSVKDLVIVDGNSYLVEAARQAVLQWRYEPFTQCGEPLEKQLDVFVRFRPK